MLDHVRTVLKFILTFYWLAKIGSQRNGVISRLWNETTKSVDSVCQNLLSRLDTLLTFIVKYFEINTRSLTNQHSQEKSPIRKRWTTYLNMTVGWDSWSVLLRRPRTRTATSREGLFFSSKADEKWTINLPFWACWLRLYLLSGAKVMIPAMIANKSVWLYVLIVLDCFEKNKKIFWDKSKSTPYWLERDFRLICWLFISKLSIFELTKEFFL